MNVAIPTRLRVPPCGFPVSRLFKHVIDSITSKGRVRFFPQCVSAFFSWHTMCSFLSTFYWQVRSSKLQISRCFRFTLSSCAAVFALLSTIFSYRLCCHYLKLDIPRFAIWIFSMILKIHYRNSSQDNFNLAYAGALLVLWFNQTFATRHSNPEAAAAIFKWQ